MRVVARLAAVEEPASTTRHTLFPTEAQLRAALSKVLSITKAELLLYDLVDDHLHVVIWCSEARRTVLQRALLLALRPLASTELAAAHPKRIEGRSHLLWLVRYLLLQVEKHGLAAHPALWSGSCFQDLVGARCVLPLSARLARALPRLRLSMVQEIVGIPLRPIEPISAARLRVSRDIRVILGWVGSYPLRIARRSAARVHLAAELASVDPFAMIG